MKRLFPLIALALAGCATAPAQPEPPLLKATASGLPEGTFHNTTIAAVQAKFATTCLGRGGEVQDVNPMQITCVIMITGHQVDVIAVQQGGYFQPRGRTQWTMIQVSSDVRVTGQTWLETNNIGGPSKTPITSNTVRNKVQSTMFAMGAE